MPDETDNGQRHPQFREALEDRLRAMERAMELLKEAREVAQEVVKVVEPIDPTGHFTGLSGIAKQLASTGVIGALTLLLLWVVIYEIPGARQKFIDLLLRVEADNRMALTEERDSCREEARLWREHSANAVTSVTRNLERINARIDEQNKQMMVNQLDILWLLQQYAPKKVGKAKDTMGFIGPPTPEEDMFIRIMRRAELLPFPMEHHSNE